MTPCKFTPSAYIDDGNVVRQGFLPRHAAATAQAPAPLQARVANSRAPGNKVGVEVRFEGIRQSEAHPLGDLEITVHTPLRVDDGGYSGSRRTDQI